MKRYWLLALLLCCGSTARADVLDGLVVTAGIADEVSTYRALQQPGLYEAGLMRNTGLRIGTKAIVGAAVIGGAHELDKHGRRGWSKAIRIMAVALWGGAAVNNAIRARGVR